MSENRKDPFYQQWWFIILIIILAVGIIENAFDDSDQAKMERADAITAAFQEEAVKEKIVENKPKPDVIAEHLIKKRFGFTKEEKENTMISAEYEDGVVEVIIVANKVLTAKTLKQASLTTAFDYMQSMKSRPDVNQANFIVQAPLTDPFGNVKTEDVMIVLMSRETLDKVNFEHFKVGNFSKVSDSYWEHPTLTVK
ncbi:hypothetical protein [Psychrobacillus lasiicapitis]|uniref:Uncharacterized protein n=1 Tax=Psychrobacillus lasiicapitis TaxID=1636719 RepID=A0A544TAU1_9BACI|nr:hypothetical protein [Psychrobacillus lasiicapitis]TQR14577.1 hypothetical protein FG382_09000 [Psychrobacillus lasiicapitis]GGA30227.1 hypothetical protein GCM10011384_19530 [Psychrobacillus lasiicapitis]